MTSNALDLRSCDVCAQMFPPRSDTAVVCSPRCALKIVRDDQKARAADRRATRLALLALKPRAKWLAEAKSAFQTWVVQRDAALPCVSCGRHHKGKIDGGHYIAAGACEALAFDPVNCWAQCSPCNTRLSGNLVRYRAELERRIGPEEVRRLESCRDRKAHTIAELQAIRDRYRLLVRDARPVGFAASHAATLGESRRDRGK